jgi:hypothetical protein
VLCPGIVSVRLHNSRSQLQSAGKGKSEGCTEPVIRSGPEAAIMTFNDRAANGKSDAHAIGLGRVEGVKNLLNLPGIYVDTGTDRRTWFVSSRRISTTRIPQMLLMASAALRIKFRMTC